jgi:hypothetical protein
MIVERRGLGTGTNPDKLVWMTPPYANASTRLVGIPFCPDLLTYESLGAADNWRGRVVRGFFFLLRVWPT